MEEKLAKVRAEIEKLNAQLLRGACSSQIAMETRCKEEAYNEVLAILDTMQEEPISIDFEQELYKAFGQVKDFTLGMQIAKKFYEIGRLSNVRITVKNWKDPVSEELEQEIDKYVNIPDNQGLPDLRRELSDCARHFANWQKQKNQETIELAEDHAMLAGMEKIKEQIMKDSLEREVRVDAGGYPYIPQMELYDYDKDIPLAKEGDKYKVILIKED